MPRKKKIVSEEPQEEVGMEPEEGMEEEEGADVLSESRSALLAEQAKFRHLRSLMLECGVDSISKLDVLEGQVNAEIAKQA